MTNHTLEKAQWLVVSSLTVGNLIKIDSFSDHTLEEYPSSQNPSFEPAYTSYVHIFKGARERRYDRWSNHRKASTDWWLHWGYLESLAFKAFDKILIFGYWLSKTLKLALAFRAFLLENAFTISLVNYFQNSKIFFKNVFKWFSKNRFWCIFVCVKLSCFPEHTLQLHMCKPRVVRFNFCYTFIYSYICCAWKIFPLSFQNAWHHPSYWVEPRLSVKGKCWICIP